MRKSVLYLFTRHPDSTVSDTNGTQRGKGLIIVTPPVSIESLRPRKKVVVVVLLLLLLLLLKPFFLIIFLPLPNSPGSGARER